MKRELRGLARRGRRELSRIDAIVRLIDEQLIGSVAKEELRAAEHEAQRREVEWSDQGHTKESRRKLIPNWAWNIRQRGRMR